MAVTTLKEVTFKELLGMFHESVRDQITKSAISLNAEYVVCFENLQMDSSKYGQRTAMMVGPSCTYKTIDAVKEGRLGDVPSRFQYPTAYAKVERRK